MTSEIWHLSYSLYIFVYPAGTGRDLFLTRSLDVPDTSHCTSTWCVYETSSERPFGTGTKVVSFSTSP